MKGTLSNKGKSVVDAPRNGRQSAKVVAPSMKGKITFSAPSMKEKSTDLPKEGKYQEKLNLNQL